MNVNSSHRSPFRWFAAGAAIGAAAYAGYVGATWLRYGRRRRATAAEADSLLNHFLPNYEIIERHSTQVAAPAPVTLSAALDCDPASSAIVRAIIRSRELLLGADAGPRPPHRGLLAHATALGWGVLAAVPGREVVFGAVTRPWEANVVFRAIPAHQFAAFAEPGYVKIAWSIRADPAGFARSIARTETRAATTDPISRARFRAYWSFLSPGILFLRYAILRLVRRQAQQSVASHFGLRAATLRIPSPSVPSALAAKTE